jgi:hypothetical protein
VVVIGDTYLAVNDNLESDVNIILPDNVIFWRWLLTHVTDQDDWVPSAPQDTDNGLPAELPLEEPTARDPAAPQGDSIPAGPSDEAAAELPGEAPPEDPTMDDMASDEVTP